MTAQPGQIGISTVTNLSTNDLCISFWDEQMELTKIFLHLEGSQTKSITRKNQSREAESLTKVGYQLAESLYPHFS